MPVKLTENGKPLEESLAQVAPPEQAEPKPAQTNAVDALLEQAAAIPAALPVVAKAEVGALGKDGAQTVETTEHMKVWLTAPHPGYTGPFGKITYGMGATLNTGNYENLRPFVQIEIPFIPGQQDEAYAYAESWADARITSIINNSKAQISGA